MAAPLAALLGVMALTCVGVYFFARGQSGEPSPPANPAELKTALIFGGLYALVLLGTAAAQHALGTTGLYGVAILSGVHDLDAITLSTARLVDQNQLVAGTGWRLILSACLSNLVVKGALVGILGGRRLLRWIAWPYLMALGAGLGVLWLWPSDW
jgi:uncharacterized membrane protein (DUF4010 family)